jgi:hypothetical protein
MAAGRHCLTTSSKTWADMATTGRSLLCTRLARPDSPGDFNPVHERQRTACANAIGLFDLQDAGCTAEFQKRPSHTI